MLIEGEKAVRILLDDMIKNVETDLFEFIKGIEREFSTRIISEIFDIIPKRIKESRTEVERCTCLKDLHDIVMVLDTLIENDMLNPYLPRNTGSTEATTLLQNRTSVRDANFAFHTFRHQIAEPRTVLLQCEESKTYRIRIDGHGTPHFGTEANSTAIDTWLAHYSHNEEWERYFFQRHQIADYSMEHNPEFFQRFGFAPYYIAALEQHLEERAERKQNTHYTCIRERDIIRRMIGQIPLEQLHRLLEFLTYRPGRNFGLCMYVPLSNRSKFDYVFGKPAVSLTTGSLMTYITRGGTMMTHYGDAFNEYVANQLESKTSFQVIGREVIFRRDMIESTGARKEKGNEIRVDILATHDETLYAISCKAHNMMWDLRQESRLMFVPYADFYKRARNNLADRKEVVNWLRLIEESSEKLIELGFKGGQITPLLITAECEPLQLDRVRSWFEAEIGRVPECEQYSILELEMKYPKNQ